MLDVEWLLGLLFGPIHFAALNFLLFSMTELYWDRLPAILQRLISIQAEGVIIYYLLEGYGFGMISILVSAPALLESAGGDDAPRAVGWDLASVRDPRNIGIVTLRAQWLIWLAFLSLAVFFNAGQPLNWLPCGVSFLLACRALLAPMSRWGAKNSLVRRLVSVWLPGILCVFLFAIFSGLHERVHGLDVGSNAYIGAVSVRFGAVLFAFVLLGELYWTLFEERRQT
jgi:hypothetical protein